MATTICTHVENFPCEKNTLHASFYCSEKGARDSGKRKRYSPENNVMPETR